MDILRNIKPLRKGVLIRESKTRSYDILNTRNDKIMMCCALGFDKFRCLRMNCRIHCLNRCAAHHSFYKVFMFRCKLPRNPLQNCLVILKSNSIPHIIDISYCVLTVRLRNQERDCVCTITQCCPERVLPNAIRSNGTCLRWGMIMQIDLLNNGILMEFCDGVKKVPVFLFIFSDLDQMIPYLDQ